MEYKWLLFCSQLPPTPSSPRVMVWRRMHSAGSVSLDNGLWVLPYNEESEKLIQEIKGYVERQAGSVKVFLANSLDDRTEAEILDRFRHDRSEEYAEIDEQCQDFLAEIDKETKRQNFSFAEYEENEQDLVKLEGWFAKVQRRDFLSEDRSKETMAWLEKCRVELQKFAIEVFNHEDYERPDKMQKNPENNDH